MLPIHPVELLLEADETRPAIYIQRSAKRKKTVQLKLCETLPNRSAGHSSNLPADSGPYLLLLTPARYDAAKNIATILRLADRVLAKGKFSSTLDNSELARRAVGLVDKYLPEITTDFTITWVTNQHKRWGSCSAGSRQIRISAQLAQMPDWVVDYVVIHELAHLLQPNHSAAFHQLVSRYPDAQKASGFLLGWQHASNAKNTPKTADETDNS